MMRGTLFVGVFAVGAWAQQSSLLDDLRSMSANSGGGGAGAAQPVDPLDPMALDLACATGPKAAAWQEAKKKFRSLFEGPFGSFDLVPKAKMATVTDDIMEGLKVSDAMSPGSPDECGLGRLAVQLLTLAQIDDPAPLAFFFQSYEKLASPVLTLLLDMPWPAFAVSGWPIFGLLAQLSYRKLEVPEARNSDAVDGVTEQVANEFRALLFQGLQAQDANIMFQASAMFLNVPWTGSGLVPITALAAQANGVADPMQRIMVLENIQGSFKQLLQTPSELDIVMGTTWPLFSLLHEAVMAFPAL